MTSCLPGREIATGVIRPKAKAAEAIEGEMTFSLPCLLPLPFLEEVRLLLTTGFFFGATPDDEVVEQTDDDDERLTTSMLPFSKALSFVVITDESKIKDGGVDIMMLLGVCLCNKL